MAGRVRSRRALRDEHDESERIEEDAADPEAADDTPKAETKARKPRAKKAAAVKAAKAPAKPRVRKKSSKLPPRMFAKWAVCDGGLKRVAVFEYNDRAGADARLAHLQDQKKGSFVIQLVKEQYDPPPVEVVVAV